jgi:GTP-binding protein HflX
VLIEIGAAEIPQVLVFNKLDALEKERYPLQLVDNFDLAGVQTPRIFLSAINGDGVPALRQQLGQIVSRSVLPAREKTDFTESGETAPHWAQSANDLPEKKR